MCTATNSTPHERFFNFRCRSTSRHSLPSWLTTPGPVLLRQHVRNTKYEPLVDQVDLVEANPEHALIQYPDGHKSTASLRDLAPSGVPQDNNIDMAPTNANPGDHTEPSNNFAVDTQHENTFDNDHALDSNDVASN